MASGCKGGTDSDLVKHKLKHCNKTRVKKKTEQKKERFS